MRRIIVTTALNHWQGGRLRRQTHATLLPDELPEPAFDAADALDRLDVAEVLALMDQSPDGNRCACACPMVAKAASVWCGNDACGLMRNEEF